MMWRLRKDMQGYYPDSGESARTQHENSTKTGIIGVKGVSEHESFSEEGLQTDSVRAY